MLNVTQFFDCCHCT